MRRPELLFLLLVIPFLFGSARVGQRLPSFAVEDQFERVWKSDDYRGKITLYIACDLSGYEYSDNWSKPLVEKYEGKIAFAPVADVRLVPGLMKGFVRGRFEDEFSYSILLDWEGDLIDAIGLKEGLPTLLLVDKSGVIRYRASGKGTRSQVARVKAQIDALL